MANPNRKPVLAPSSGASDQVGDIIFAAKSGNVAKVAKILASFPEAIRETDANGFTPLHFACHHSDLALVRLLLASPGVDCRAEDIWRRWPLHYSYTSPSKTLKRLIRAATLPPERRLEIV